MEYYSIKPENVSGKTKNYLWFGEMELYLKLVQNNYLLPWNLKKKILQLHAEREL